MEGQRGVLDSARKSLYVITKLGQLQRLTIHIPLSVGRKNAYLGLQELEHSPFMGKKQYLSSFDFDLCALFQTY